MLYFCSLSNCQKCTCSLQSLNLPESCHQLAPIQTAPPSQRQCFNKSEHQCDKINAEISLGKFPRKVCRLSRLTFNWRSTTFSEFPFLGVSRREQKCTSFYGKMKECCQRREWKLCSCLCFFSSIPNHPVPLLCSAFQLLSTFSLFPSHPVLIGNVTILCCGRALGWPI